MASSHAVVMLGIPARANAGAGGMRTAFRAEGEQFSEPSDAGTSMVQEVFGFIKENVSGA
jgi:hypothetical protein